MDEQTPQTYNTRNIVIGIVVVGLLVAGFFFFWPKKTQAPANDTKTSTNTGNQTQSDITVSSPLPNTIVTSPLVVTGQAIGPWYFEASFPATLKDSSGNTIATGVMTAQSDWMTTSLVPFSGTLTFPPQTGTGTLILRKDNPSGDPINDASITIPVNF